MPWNGSGTFTRAHNWSADRDAGGTSAIIDADKMDEEFDNYKTGLEKCLTRDGQNNPLADLPMAGQKHTGVGNAAARDQYAAVGQVQDQAFTHVATVGGTADAIVLTPVPAISAYAAGQSFSFNASGANTGAVTVDVSGLGARNVTKNGVLALAAGDIAAGAAIRLQYDGTRFQLVSPHAGDTDNVAGPASAVDERIAVFDGTSGKLLKDSGSLLADLGDVDGPAVSVDGRIATFSGTSGKTLQDSGKSLSDIAPITTRGDVIRGDASGNAERLAVGTSGQVLTSDGTDVAWSDARTTAPPIGNVLAPHKGLVVRTVATATVRVEATAVVVEDSTGNTASVPVGNNAHITASGYAGLDTGSEAVSTWYHIWVIYSGSAVGVLLSTSSTAPTMPSGFTYKGYVGAVYNDGAGNFVNFYQVGDATVRSDVLVLSNGSSTNWTAINLGAIVPPTATGLGGSVGGNDNDLVDLQVNLAANSAGWGRKYLRLLPASSGSASHFPYELILVEAQTMYYKVNDGLVDADVRVSSWRY